MSLLAVLSLKCASLQSATKHNRAQYSLLFRCTTLAPKFRYSRRPTEFMPIRMSEVWKAVRSPGTQDDSRERIAEIAEILALGLVRLHARQSSQTSAVGGESSLEPVGHQSGHANPETENGE